jgi:hypothetical protein
LPQPTRATEMLNIEPLTKMKKRTKEMQCVIQEQHFSPKQYLIPTNWGEVVRKGLRDWKEKHLQAIVCKLAWGSTVYNIWKFRNDVKFGNICVLKKNSYKKSVGS